MTTPLDALAEAVSALRDLWPGEHIEGAEGARLVALNDAIGRSRRLVDALHAQVASEISRQSRKELGPEGLAKTQGFRNPTALIAATTGTTNGEAARLVQVGDATAPRVLLTGEHAPSRHPHVGEALASGRIGTAAASAIITMLDRVVLRAGRDATEQAEGTLAAQAPGLSMDQLARIIARAEAWLDPNGVEPREDELRADRHLHIREDRSGMIVLSGRFDPEHGAPIKAAIEAVVSAEIRALHDGVNRSGTEERPHPRDGGMPPARRTVPQMQADALAVLCEHVLGCDHRDVPVAGATVVVRVDLDDLQAGTGFATIDGVATPVSISTARRMAADGGIIPCVLGGKSEILDWGRTKRLFTKPQRLALVERDGGCAMCGAPPGWTKVHHVRWWMLDSGPTDLSNGVLLCESCHHHIHDNGFEIRVDGTGTDASVWFIPPAHIDRSRTPRLGGRRRFDYVPAA